MFWTFALWALGGTVVLSLCLIIIAVAVASVISMRRQLTRPKD